MKAILALVEEARWHWRSQNDFAGAQARYNRVILIREKRPVDLLACLIKDSEYPNESDECVFLTSSFYFHIDGLVCRYWAIDGFARGIADAERFECKELRVSSVSHAHL